MLDLGTILKSGRLRKGMSQITLARKLGVNSSSISRWEKNQQVIAGDTLIEAAKILDITQELFPEYDINLSDGTPLNNSNVYNIVRSLQYKITALEEKVNSTSMEKKFKIKVFTSITYSFFEWLTGSSFIVFATSTSLALRYK